jgi:hypothetical protein
MHGREERSAYNILVGRYQGKGPLGRHRYDSCVNNSKTNLKETGLEGLGWTRLTQSKDHQWTPVNTVNKFQVPYNVGDFLTS